MGGGTFGLALAAGMIATVNPCGLPMLPAYLTWFVTGGDGPRASTPKALVRALKVSAALAAGFMVVFGITGMIVAWGTRAVYEVVPWITIVVGVALVGLGGWLVSGRQLTVAMPKLERGGRRRDVPSMFVFGISYAVASISCTLPVFLSQVTSTFDESLLGGLGVFVTYSLGMALVVTALTVSVAVARTGLVSWLRRSLAVINRVAGGFLIVAGAYVAYYGAYELRSTPGDDAAVSRVTGWSAELSNLVQDIGAANLAVALVLVAAAVGIIGWLLGQRRDDGPDDGAATEGDEPAVSAPASNSPV